MKFLLTVCGGEPEVTEPAKPPMDIDAWVEELDGSGVRLFGDRLAEGTETVRVRDGEQLVTDGPYAEGKEYIAGIDVLECASLEEAQEVAARHPMASYVAVEVRPFA